MSEVADGFVVRPTTDAAIGTVEKSFVPFPDIAHHIKSAVLLLCASAYIPGSTAIAIVIIRVHTGNRGGICAIGIERIAAAVGFEISGLVPFIFSWYNISCSISRN